MLQGYVMHIFPTVFVTARRYKGVFGEPLSPKPSSYEIRRDGLNQMGRLLLGLSREHVGSMYICTHTYTCTHKTSWASERPCIHSVDIKLLPGFGA